VRARRPLERERATLRGHRAAVYEASWDAEGKQIVTASADGTARVWSAEGDPRAIIEHGGVVHEAIFDPTGKLVATAGDDGAVKIWDASTGAAVRTLAGHHGPVRSLAWGARLVSGGDDGQVIVWDVAAGKSVAIMTHGAAIEAIELSPDGARVASGGADGMARLWRTETGEAIGGPLDGDGGGGDRAGAVDDVAFAKSGALATGAENGTVAIWNPDGTLRARIHEHTGKIDHVVFTPDGTSLITSSEDHTARIWTTKGDALVTLPHAGPVRMAAPSPNGELIATVSDDLTLRLWDAKSGAPLASLDAHTAPVDSVAWSLSGLVTASEDGTARIWDAGAGELVSRFACTRGWSATSRFAGDDQVITACEDGPVRAWRGTSGEVIRTLSPGHAERAFAVSADGTKVAIAGDKVGVWASGRDPIATIDPKDAGGAIASFAFSPDGALASAGDGGVALWDAATGKRVRQVATERANAVAWTHDGRSFAAAGDDGKTRVFLASGDLSATLDGGSHPALGVMWSPDGRSLAVTSDDGVRLWNVARATAFATYPLATGAAFTQKGDRVAIVGGARELRVVDARDASPLLSIDDAHAIAVAFDPHGDLLASAGADGRTRVWDARRGRLLAELPGSGDARSLAFDDAGTRLLAATSKEETVLWDVAPDDAGAGTLADIAERVGWRLVDGRLVRE
jgi:WD40 repeat protein